MSASLDRVRAFLAGTGGTGLRLARAGAGPGLGARRDPRSRIAALCKEGRA